jgi:quinol-cytochrome oxidoreductase complex cytochrome b subunit
MTEIPEEEKTIPFYPDHIKTEAVVAIVIIILAFAIGVFSMYYPVGIDEPADPMSTPSHTKPEWYFLFLYEILKYIPKTIGSIIHFIGLFLLIIWPFIDRKADSKKARRNRIVLAFVVMTAIIALTLIGGLS